MLNRQQSISHRINKNRWNFTVRLFHWLSVLLLVTTWLFVFLHNNLDDSNHIYILWHRSLGLLFLVWVITRLLNRIGTSDLKPLAKILSKYGSFSTLYCDDRYADNGFSNDSIWRYKC
jgi:cytochrome b561